MLHLVGTRTVDGSAATTWAFLLVIVPVGLGLILRVGVNPGVALMWGLAIFAAVFAINPRSIPILVLAYTDEDSVALNVGFYYMANAGGRLLGTLASGFVFQLAGFRGLSLELRCFCAGGGLIVSAAAEGPRDISRPASVGEGE